MKSESPRRTAERIIKGKSIAFSKDGPISDWTVTFRETDITSAIEAALKDRDERAAKIAETRPESRFDYGHEPAPTEQSIRNGIAAAIRGSKE